MDNLRRQVNRIMSRHVAFDLLNPHFDGFSECIKTGVATLGRDVTANRARWRPRTLANVLNDYIVADAIRRFQDEPGWSINEEYAGAFFILDGRAALRFKKVDGEMNSSNVATERQDNLSRQREIEGIEKATVITIG